MLPEPTCNCIGIVLPEFSIYPVVPEGTVKNKSDKLYTSIKPPTPSTLILVP